MPITDMWVVLRWWGALFLIGAAAFPLTKRLFGWIPGPTFAESFGRARQARDDKETHWHDQGYFFSKAVGMATVAWLVLVLGMSRVAPFTQATIMAVIATMFVFGVILHREPKSLRFPRVLNWKTIVTEELFFLAALFCWSWVKGHEPSIRGLEKFMDFGFMNSLLHSTYFPAVDMWYPPLTINYYYFGHLVTAVLTKLSGLDLAYTFNLMLATIFACTLTMSFSIGYQLWHGASRKRAFFAAILTSFLVTLAGNMQTFYAFTRGYTGEDVKPFWQLLWNIPQLWRVNGLAEVWGKLGEGINTYWYANATRFIPYSIHEFPSYSFVVSDVHGHVLSIPFVLLAIGLLITFFSRNAVSHVVNGFSVAYGGGLRGYGSMVFYGFLVGVLLMTNALDGPIYFGLFVVVLVITNKQYPISNWKNIGIVAGAAIVTSLPFLVHFKSFVNGVALNCPPQFIANSHIGPLLFEGVEKCQRSPFWMLWILWGFFWFCGIGWMLQKIGHIGQIRHIGHIWNTKFTQVEKLLVIFFGISVALIVFPEFFYFKDIYPQHFRSNTMFKLGYQAFILFSIVSAYAIVTFVYRGPTHVSGIRYQVSWVRRIFFIFLLPQLFLVAIYPVFSVRSYFGSLRNYEGVYGLTWLAAQYPNDYAGILWMNNNVSRVRCQVSSKDQLMTHDTCGMTPVLVEADGDSYTDYQRYSVFTGMPTPIGWAVHEWLWRGSYDVVSPRREDVRKIYESEDLQETKELLDRYNVRYIIVGALEREKFTTLQEWKFGELGKKVFEQGETHIYEYP